jgi:hypothetical protein
MLNPFHTKNGGVFASVFCLFLFLSLPEIALGWDVGTAIGEGIAAVIYPIALGLGGLFIGIAGLGLDMSIKYLIVGMGGMLNNELGVGISHIWVMIRDIFNIFFIFSFIFLGIKTILNSDDSSTRRGIINIIIAGLFINFSLLIALTIIDFSNIAATQIYQLILNSAGMTATAGGGPEFLTFFGKNTISGAFMDVASVGSWLTPGYPAGIEGFNKVLYSLMMMVFFMITAIIFVFATYHIIYRFVALCIYLILSPVLFIGLILPNFKGYSDKWLKGLLKQSFYAPAFLFMLYISLVVLSRLKGMASLSGDPNVGYTTMFEGKGMTSDSFAIFLLFALSIGFIYASVKVGDMMGIAGAKTAVGAVDAVKNWGQRTAYRPIGAAFNRWGVGNIDRLNQLAESEKGTPGRRRALAARALMGGREGSENIRTQTEKLANYGGREAREKAEKALIQRATRGEAVRKIEDAIKGGSVQAMQRAVRDASNAQLLEIAESKEGKEALISVSGSLSASQVKALTESDKLTDDFKKRLKEKREEQVLSRVGTDYANANKADLTALGPDRLADPAVAVNLSEKQIDALDFADIDKANIKTAREGALVAIVGGATIGGLTVNDLLNKKPEFIADLPKGVFTVASFTRELPIAALEEIYRKHNKVTQGVIRTELESIAHGPYSTRQEALYNFFEYDRIGKNFGQ